MKPERRCSCWQKESIFFKTVNFSASLKYTLRIQKIGPFSRWCIERFDSLEGNSKRIESISSFSFLCVDKKKQHVHHQNRLRFHSNRKHVGRTKKKPPWQNSLKKVTADWNILLKRRRNGPFRRPKWPSLFLGCLRTERLTTWLISPFNFS